MHLCSLSKRFPLININLFNFIAVYLSVSSNTASVTSSTLRFLISLNSASNFALGIPAPLRRQSGALIAHFWGPTWPGPQL